MRDKIVANRRKWGDNWLSFFPEKNLEIPWRQLVLQEFLDFDDLFRSGKYTSTEVEDEIFRLAVLDPVFTYNLDILPAGTVSTVAQQIFQFSGPISVEQLDNDLNIARSLTQDFLTSAVTLICTVFPAYTPEQAFGLKYDVLLKRLSMAERRLLEMGILKEPLTVVSESAAAPPPPAERELPSVKRKREIIESRRKDLETKLADLNKNSAPTDKLDPSHTLITKHQMAMPVDPEMNGSHDMLDAALWQHDALSGIESIYPEYFKLMKEGKKITPNVVKQTRGTTKEEVEKKHEEYVQKVKNKEIKIEPPKFLIADKIDGRPAPKEKKKKVTVKRRG